MPGFLERINKTVREIPAPNLKLPKWNRTDKEGEYNKRAASVAGCLHFDAKNVSYGGGASKFEFCDFMHVKHKTLCFAKIASKSSGMSHLVEQVRRTTELLFGLDGLYRSKIQKVFTKHHPTADAGWLDTRPKAGDWSMCLVSLGRPATGLPFFAKCSLAKLQRELDMRGHPMFFADV